jgi:hypothetical protein
MPAVQMYMPSAAPRSTTLVSPPTISTSAVSAAAASASTSALRSSAARPSSRISDSVSACGRAPATARSLTVPFTARSPIEPPGKRSGLTTNESVVNASAAPPISIAAESSLVWAPKAGWNSPSIML